MGLVISHGIWSGSYSSFHEFRAEMCRTAGFDMDAVYGSQLKTPEQLAFMVNGDDHIHILANHEDNDGFFTPRECALLAIRLQELLPIIRIEWRETTETFIGGLLGCAALGQSAEFN